MKLTIERYKWLRGEGSARSALLRADDSKMCCLGFYCLALGVPESVFGGAKMPYTLPQDKREHLPAWLMDLGEEDYFSHTDVLDLALLNDNVGLDQDAREQLIIAVFARHDVQVEFV